MTVSNRSGRSGLTWSVGDFLVLARISNLPLAAADVMMGFLVARGSCSPGLVLAGLIVSSSLLYTGGMVLNDVCDAEEDARLRPERPIPAGRVARRDAGVLAACLLVFGLAWGWAAGILPSSSVSPWWRSGVVASLLAAAIVLYDAALKATPAGPLAMGLCRALNVLLGLSAGAAVAGPGAYAGFAPHAWIAAAGIGIYITGVTWFARSEAGPVRAGASAAAVAVMVLGVAMLGAFQPWLPLALRTPAIGSVAWAMLLGAIALAVVRRCSSAIFSGRTDPMRVAVKHALWTLVLLDATLALQATLPRGHVVCAVAIVALLVPAVILSRWVPST